MYVHTNSSTVHFTCKLNKIEWKAYTLYDVSTVSQKIPSRVHRHHHSTIYLFSVVWVIALLNGKIGVVRSQHSLVLSLDGCAPLFIAVFGIQNATPKRCYFFWMFEYKRKLILAILSRSISRYKFCAHTNTSLFKCHP